MHYVKDTKELTEICSKLQKSKILSIDTGIREKTYWPNCVLSRFITDLKKIIIDPLSSDIDLKPFLKFLIIKKF